MQYVEDFQDYKLIDMANSEKLEKWGKYILIRPDPQIIWDKKTDDLWSKLDARYLRSTTGGGHWDVNTKLPDSWQVKYKELVFNIKPMGFKHTGLFPEQAVNWNYIIDKINKESKSRKEKIKVLNLFAYTGGATVASLYAGAEVCHVDSSKGMVNWAKENVKSSKLEEEKIRYIVDDVVKFVEREIRRENKYDSIIMDPPSYGRGANGEVWSIEKDLYNLIEQCIKLLSEKPLFLMINTYTGGLSGTIIQNSISLAMQKNRPELLKTGKITSDEIGIKMENENLILPCGITTKWELGGNL